MTTKFNARSTIVAAAVAGFCIPNVPAQAQNIPGWGYAQRYIGDIQRQQRVDQRRTDQYQRQQFQEQQQADAQARAPHEASAQYTGQLTPMSDLSRFVSGKTFYLERPIVAGNQIQSMRTDQVYLAADGRSYSVAWSGRSWMTDQNAVCLDSISPQNCWRVFQDDARQVFFVNATNILMRVARIERGDAANTKSQYAQNQRQLAAQGAAMEQIAGALAQGLFNGDSGSGRTIRCSNGGEPPSCVDPNRYAPGRH